ncbi:hypothetical protein LLB_3127 [Legionella longbeachae D-4968]|nr:hypothetical protein LLB_3127 [Legionella longbeachae D-4968]
MRTYWFEVAAGPETSVSSTNAVLVSIIPEPIDSLMLLQNLR